MAKAIAIAVPQDYPFRAAAASAKNLSSLVLDFMYGTPQRTKVTYAFATGLFVLAYFMQVTQTMLPFCPS